jgi:hypothetical protein
MPGLQEADRRSGRGWRAVPIAALGLAVGCGAVACGDGGSSSAGTNGSDAGSGAAQFGPEEFGLTLDELAARIEQVEGLIGQCMTDAGFEYVPVDFERVKAGMDADKTAPGLSDEEFVAQYGYGITTQFDKPGREIGLGEQNVAIYEAMSPAEQAAYGHTLFGDNRDATFALSVEAEDFSGTGGCTRQAVEQSFTPSELDANYLNPGDAVLEQDPRVVAAMADWSDCVAADGFTYAHPDDVETDLKQRLDALTAGADPATLTGPAADALTELQGEELAIAAVATTCEEDAVDPVVEEVETELYGAPQS